jgi:ABC-type lipoprotein export system ATPase subunit
MLYAGVDAETRDRKAKEALAAVGLAGREQNHPNQLSGGQQQRVAVARALVNDPALILADEPTGNLDSRTSVEVMEIFQRLNRERGITLVLVTHEADIAQDAPRVVADNNHQREQYVRRHWKRDWRDCANYHLCVNTAWLGLDGAADLVVQLARERFG